MLPWLPFRTETCNENWTLLSLDQSSTSWTWCQSSLISAITKNHKCDIWAFCVQVSLGKFYSPWYLQFVLIHCVNLCFFEYYRIFWPVAIRASNHLRQEKPNRTCTEYSDHQTLRTKPQYLNNGGFPSTNHSITLFEITNRIWQ